MSSHRVSYWKTVVGAVGLSVLAWLLAGLLAFGPMREVAPAPVAGFTGALRWLVCGMFVGLGLATLFVAVGGCFALHADAQEGHHRSALRGG